MERKLASIQKVEDVYSITDADLIEQIEILGWNLVAKKGEFKKNDLCVFFEIDSVLPEEDWSEFMKSSKYRVKTKKMKGVLSQGLALPISSFPTLNIDELSVGTDVTELLKITKYEATKSLGLNQAGLFPHFIPKTDEHRIQSFPKLLNEFRGQSYYYTLKIDGTSATYAKYNNVFYECSRNYQMQPDSKYYGQINKKYKISKVLPNGFAIQGEIFGEGIQKNRLSIKGLDFYVFNVFDIINGCYLDIKDMLQFCLAYDFKTVPYTFGDKPFDFTIDELLELANGVYAGTNNQREGLVFRPIVEQYSPILGGRLSFKVINNNYLLNGGN